MLASIKKYRFSLLAALALTLLAACSPDEGATVVLLDLATMQHSVLLESEDPGFVSVAWDTDDTVLLLDPAGAEYLLTISTGTLTPPDY